MKPKGGLSADEARRILAKNPALRAQGKGTNWVLERAGKAWKKPEGTESAPAEDFFGALVQVRANQRRELERISEAAQKLRQETVAVNAAACAELNAWLEAHDPKRTFEETRETIDDEAKFLLEIGFNDPAHKPGPVR